jgi:hypothetical protein
MTKLTKNRHVVQQYKKVMVLVASCIKLETALAKEGNNRAARLVKDARCSLNTLETCEAARLFDLIAEG